MTALILDSQALSLFVDSQLGSKDVMAAVRAAANMRRPVVVPSVVLAELFRGPARKAAVSSTLNRNQDMIRLRDTDRDFAALVGGVLYGAGADSADMVDAHCVAAAVEFGGGVILTSDSKDVERLAAPYGNVIAEKVDR